MVGGGVLPLAAPIRACTSSWNRLSLQSRSRQTGRAYERCLGEPRDAEACRGPCKCAFLVFVAGWRRRLLSKQAAPLAPDTTDAPPAQTHAESPRPPTDTLRTQLGRSESHERRQHTLGRVTKRELGSALGQRTPVAGREREGWWAPEHAGGSLSRWQSPSFCVTVGTAKKGSVDACALAADGWPLRAPYPVGAEVR